MPAPAFLRRTLLALAVAACSAGAAAQTADPKPAIIVKQEMSTGEVLLRIMLAETAAVRAQPELAAYLYVDLAQTTRDARIAKRATELSLQVGQIELGGKAARLWSTLEPNSSNALQALALALSGEHANLADIEPPLRRMLESDTLPTELLLGQLPQLLSRYPDKAAAAAMLERLTQPYLQYPEAHLTRAIMSLSAGDMSKAEREAQKVLDIRPDAEAAALVRAEASPQKRRAAAMEELGKFGKRYPQAKLAREAYARWLVSEGRQAEASEAFNRLQAEFPDDDDLSFQSVGMLLQIGDTARAEGLIKKLLARQYRASEVLYLQLGEIQANSGRAQEAVVSYSAVPVGKYFLTARLRAADLLASKQGQYADALRVLAEGAEKSPADVVMLTLAQAELLNRNKQPEQALALLEKLMLSKPEALELRFQAAMLADQLKRYEQMEQWLRQVLTAKPDNASALNALGYSLADRNIRLDEADGLLAQAFKLEPGNGAIVDSLGWLRFRQGRYDDALELLRKAYVLQADGEIAAHLGEVLWQHGQQDEARAVLKAALLREPDNEALNEVVRRLLK
ncbi:tetratricopeptide repeat protein [Uliginosibacterium sediminicola]|uniref:Tetratricopeptide repeat protein n=1 Tax=Uliginosibacterium sediminicola TaxID=2024550 RepID=A0ABU9YTC1_9RHOO